jgi:hypothetical protein
MPEDRLRAIEDQFIQENGNYNEDMMRGEEIIIEDEEQ